MITPTIGRQVWFRPGLPLTHDFHVIHPEQALAATVVYAFSDRLVNLDVIDHLGKHHFLSEAVLLQDDDEPPVIGTDTGNYAEWMPYQKATAGISPMPVIDFSQADEQMKDLMKFVSEETESAMSIPEPILTTTKKKAAK